MSESPEQRERLTLDVTLIQQRMAEKGLSPSDVARELKVSREAVSSWLAGEYAPRPSKAVRFCVLLKLKFHEFYGLPAPLPEDAYLQVAYVGRSGRVAKEDRDALEMKLGGLPCIENFLPRQPVFAAAVVSKPLFTKAHLDEVAASARAVAGVRPGQPVHVTHLLKMLKDVRACVFPSRMARREGNTWTTVSLLRRTQRLAVHFPLAATQEQQLQGLAEAYGVCLSWHTLPLDDARRYGRELAERLITSDSQYDVTLDVATDLEFYEATQALGMTELTDGLEALQAEDGGRNAARVSECLAMNVLEGWAFAGMLIPQQRERRRAELKAAAEEAALPKLPDQLRVFPSPDTDLACALVVSFGPERPAEHLDALARELAKRAVTGPVLFDYLLANGTRTRRFFTLDFDGKEFAPPTRLTALGSLSEATRAAVQVHYVNHREELDLALLSRENREAFDNNIIL